MRLDPRHYLRPLSRLPLAALAVILGTAAALLSPGLVSAHASYVSSDPAANAVLNAAPSTVTIHFAEAVDPASSDIVVYDATGKQVSTGAAQVDRADLTKMTVNMQGNDSQIYLVEWHTVSASDGDADIGAFNFLVNPDSATRQLFTSTKSSGTTPTSGSTGIPVWVVALVGVLGVVVGGGGMLLARRPRGGSTSASVGSTSTKAP